MANESKKEQAPATEAQDVKKLTAALTVALTHRYGRPPSADELAHALSGEPEETQEAAKQDEAAEKASQPTTPKILDYHIFYGMKKNAQGASEEDPTNPLFYGDGDKRWFDVEKGEWSEEKPSITDHLHSRVLGDGDNQKDLFDAIINGVMDDEDYGLLSNSHDLLDPRCHKAYSLMSRLKNDTQDLEKALAKSDDDDYEPIESADDGESTVESSQDVVAGIITGAGVNAADMPNRENEPGTPPTIVNAHQEIKEATLEPGVEIRVRRLIREEITGALDLIRQEIYKALQEAVGGDGQGEEPAVDEINDDDSPMETE